VDCLYKREDNGCSGRPSGNKSDRKLDESRHGAQAAFNPGDLALKSDNFDPTSRVAGSSR
jgi:hypothetical protein